MKKIFTLFFLVFAAASLKAQFPKLVLDTFSRGYSSPLGIENAGDSRLFIVQRSGQIIICNASGTRRAQPFLDISDRASQNGDEQGLLGLAFDPNYKKNGYFFVNYIDTNGNTQISRFRVSSDKNIADPGSEVHVLQIQQPYSNHNGGCLRFGSDGYLYIGMGDGGSGGDPNNYAQNKTVLLGKMLRIDVHALPYTIPATNPFKDSSDYSPEIWALGLRNPWRFSFDSRNGNLWIGDVGQDMWEEVDLQSVNSKGGENYGWRCFEGKHPYNTTGCETKKNYTPPIYDYMHKNNNCAITGGFVYRGSLYPNMVGNYFYTDLCTGDFRMLYQDSGQWKSKSVLTYSGTFVTFGEDNKRELYVADINSGIIYHLKDKSAGLGTIASENNSLSNAALNLYPNPSHGNFILHYTSAINDQVVISIYNSMGKKIMGLERAVNAGENNINISISSQAKGNYFVQLRTVAGNMISKSLVIN